MNMRTARLVAMILAPLWVGVGMTAYAGTWLVIDSSSDVQGYGNGVYYIPGPIPGWCTFSGNGSPPTTTTWVWKNSNWYEGVPAGDSAVFYRDFFIPSGATILYARLRFRVDNFGWVDVNGTRFITYDTSSGCPDTCGPGSRDGCWSCDAPDGDIDNTTALRASLRVGQWNRLAWGVQNASGCAPSSAGGIVRLEIKYNRPPTAQNDSYTTYKNQTLTVPAPGVLGNDSDPDGDPLTAVLVSGPSQGSLTLNANGSFTYTPPTGWTGTTTFTYRAYDGQAYSNEATVTIQVLNRAPTAQNDSYTTNEDTPLTVNAPGILTNDTDPDPGDSLVAVLVSLPSQGTLNRTVGEVFNGSFTYTPPANWYGTTTFTYKARDGSGAESNVATVTITVNPVNDPPVAQNDSYTTYKNQTLTVPAPGVLGNDSDPDGDPLTAVLVSGPSQGSLTLNANGSFTYTPPEHWAGTTSFTYRARDTSNADSNIAQVTIEVINRPPIAGNRSYEGCEDAPFGPFDPSCISIDWSSVLCYCYDPDGEPLRAVLVTPPSHGTVQWNEDGTFTYYPFPDYNGGDQLVYRVIDQSGAYDEGTVTLVVNPVNDPPQCTDDWATTVKNTPVEIFILRNDTDVDTNWDSLLRSECWYPSGYVGVRFENGPFHGTVSLDCNGVLARGEFYIVYQPNPGFSGLDSFDYVLWSDWEPGECPFVPDTGRARVYVQVLNRAPTAQNDSYTTNEDTPLTVNAPGILTNDTDPDPGDSLVAVLVSLPSQGTLNRMVGEVFNGSFTYTPPANWYGTTTFTYKARDGSGAESNVATVTITVNPVNDPPVAQNDSYTTYKNQTLTVPAPGVLGNDSDPDGDPLTAVLVSGPSQGSLTLNPNGSFTYIPPTGWTGTTTFTYRTYDGQAHSDDAIVTIQVLNRAPVANDDEYFIDEDTLLWARGGQPGSLACWLPAPDGVLCNDHDPDGDIMMAQLLTSPEHASFFEFDPTTGSFRYISEENWHGVDTFRYRAVDPDGAWSEATAIITVYPLNDPVDAVDDSYTTNEDTPLNVPAPGVLGNDISPDGFGSLTVVTPPAHGSLTLNPDGSFTYTSNPNWNGTDSFVYRLTDADGDSDTATVTITVNPVNDPPVAQNDSYTTYKNQTLTVPAPGVLGNDSDPDGDPLTAVLVSGPSQGSLTLNANGSFTYTPPSGWTGTTTFTYRVYDGQAYSNTATVTITVENRAPTAQNDSYTTNEDTPLTVNAPGILTNDTDPDPGDSLVAVLFSLPSQGTLNRTVGEVFNGSFTYTPPANWYGTTTFTYKARDGSGTESNVATVTITVNPVNDPPVALNDAYFAEEDAPLIVPAPGVLSNDYDVDGDTFGVNHFIQPDHGSITLNGDGSFTYTPPANWHGVTTFRYRIQDSEGALSNWATVTITVTSVNDPVDAVDDSYSTNEDTPLNVPAPGVLGNDAYPDGVGSLAVVTPPAQGSLTLNQDGSFAYTPDANWNGTDSFVYRLTDADGDSDTATVTITVNPVNDPVDAVDDSYSTNEDTPLNVAAPGVLGNDAYPDGFGSLAVVTPPAQGSLTLNPDGSFAYTPNPNWNGTDSFVYRLTDADGDSDTATVTITVNPVNDPVDAVDDSYSTNEDTPLNVAAPGVLGNDAYPEGFGSLAVVTPPAHGSLTLNPDGSFTYTPNPNFCGIDSYTYKLCDIDGDCDEAMVTLTVTCVNDAPVAQNDTYTTSEDTPLSVLAPGVLGNDYDVDGDPLSTVLVSGPAHGTLTLNRDGSFTYIPAPKFYGADSFKYRVFDGELSSNVATVTIIVSFVNDAMEGPDVGIHTCMNEGRAFEIQINDMDILWAGFTGYPVSFELLSGPAQGTIAGDWGAVRYEEGAAILVLLYTPNANFIGTDELRVRAFDPYGQFVVLTVQIAVGNCGPTPIGTAGLTIGPVVIHEIAWAGTSAGFEDQWIELQNISDSPVNLEGWILRWRKKSPKTPEDLLWREIRLAGVLEPQGFFLLERGHDEVVKDVAADLIYPTVFRAGDTELPLLFSLDGDIVELLNDKGELVDTANADPRRLEGWAAGSMLPAAMERKSPLLPDLDENWHTNLGLVTFGKDRHGTDLLATAYIPNEPEILALAGEPLVVERGQKVTLARFASHTPKPRIAVLRTDVDGGVGALFLNSETFTVRYDNVRRLAEISVDTQTLEPGEYKVVATLENGQYAVFTLVVR